MKQRYLHRHSWRSEGNAFSHAARSEEYSLGRFFPQECSKIFASRPNAVASYPLGAPPGPETWLIHELRCGDPTTGALCVIEEHLRLIGRPNAVIISRAIADGDGGDNLCIGRSSKIDHAFPLSAREYRFESRGASAAAGLSSS